MNNNKTLIWDDFTKEQKERLSLIVGVCEDRINESTEWFKNRSKEKRSKK